MNDKLGRAKHRKKSLDFRSPVNAATVSRHVQWRLPDPVSSQEYLPPLLIIEANCPETVEALEALHSPRSVSYRQDFRVRSRAEQEALSLQFLSQFYVVVDFSVEGDAYFAF